MQLDSKDLSGKGGDKLTILVHLNRSASEEEPVKMTIASSVSQTGRLYNLIANFRERAFHFDKTNRSELHAVTLALKPKANLIPGDYTLTVGARYGTITYNKIVNLHVT